MKKIIFLFLLFVSTLFANIGTITLLEGEAFTKRGEESIRLKLTDTIFEKDFIETKSNSKVKITFKDNTIITIGKDSTLDIEEYLYSNSSNDKSNFNVTKGAFHVITGQIGKTNPDKFKLKTKNASIGIRGTEIYGDENVVFCTQGAIFVNSFGVIREVPQGFFLNTFNNQIPSLVMPINQEQFRDLISRLNTNSISNNQNPNNFDNSSTPLAFQNNQGSEMMQNQDNQNSWGYWASSIQDENNNTRTDKSINDYMQNSNNMDSSNVEYVQNLMNNTTITELNFSGDINVPNIPSIGTNYIDFNFYFGGSDNTFNASYGFEGERGNNYGGDLNGNITSTGFSGTNISGIFNGANIDSISGNITMDNGLDTLDGTFSANKQ
ncbi:FecR family protein [Aliarcobacter trophiarum]|uniref:FecR family protein n=1 Tax=Aliarcobacter trophiarum TaxID=708186 RepID=UPI00100AFAAB|nr:FecR family protein [Aliarcobacter trophiarum]RXI25038.1 hypothetical protein CRU89_09515 [Aliarcobacter trophiarum]